MTDFGVNNASTNSEEFLYSRRESRTDEAKKSDLPINMKYDTRQKIKDAFCKTMDKSLHTSAQHIEENLIQLDDSPKHSLRARKPKIIIKTELFNLNHGKNSNFRIEDEAGYSPIKIESKSNTHASKQLQRDAPSSTSSLTSPSIISNNNKIMHATSNYSTVILLPTTDIVGSRSFITDNKHDGKLKAIQELSFASDTQTFQLPLTKDKVV
jgi:hypothetical protein